MGRKAITNTNSFLLITTLTSEITSVLQARLQELLRVLHYERAALFHEAKGSDLL